MSSALLFQMNDLVFCSFPYIGNVLKFKCPLINLDKFHYPIDIHINLLIKQGSALATKNNIFY